MEQRAILIKPVSVTEIENALKRIGDLKAPRVDGFGSKFFKKSWRIVKEDVLTVVMDFFSRGRMDKKFNRTLVTLIPKHKQAKNISHFRPISCCTTVHKIISKVMANRGSHVLSSIISRSQASFVPGQKIHDHILLAYELIKGYNTKGGMPRSMLQMDIQKAYDSVDWKALKTILEEVGLSRQFIGWVMKAVMTVTYQFNINGIYTDEMKAKRGLRQGDPISLLLFVIIMEYLHQKLDNLSTIPGFNYIIESVKSSKLWILVLQMTCCCLQEVM